MSFNPELIETEKGRVQLAQEIAEILDADTSEPTPCRDNWRSDFKLRKLESEVVQGGKGGFFAGFADVCGRARVIAKETHAKCLLLLGEINGLRRLPEGERPDTTLDRLFEQAQEEIKALEDSPRKSRLQSLWSYHAGIYARVVGDYRLAAESQKKSAELAEAAGDTTGAAISSFCAAVELVNEALVSDPDSATDRLADLVAAREKLDQALKGKDDATSQRWLHLNAPNHMLESHFWAGAADYAGSSDDNLALKGLASSSVDAELAASHEAALAVAFAIAAYNRGDREAARGLAEDVVQGRCEGFKPSPEYLATAHLLLGRVANIFAGSESDAEKSREYAEQAQAHFRHAAEVVGSAHQVRAVARRALGLAAD